jgi:hypothetical protein
MRCLCYAKFLSSGAIPPGEFFAHIATKWSCIEDSPKTTIKTSNHIMPRTHILPQSIVFIADCRSVEQLALDLATMPGAGLSNVEIFPVPEMLQYQ